MTPNIKQRRREARQRRLETLASLRVQYEFLMQPGDASWEAICLAHQGSANIGKIYEHLFWMKRRAGL